MSARDNLSKKELAEKTDNLISDASASVTHYYNQSVYFLKEANRYKDNKQSALAKGYYSAYLEANSSYNNAVLKKLNLERARMRIQSPEPIQGDTEQIWNQIEHMARQGYIEDERIQQTDDRIDLIFQEVSKSVTKDFGPEVDSWYNEEEVSDHTDLHPIIAPTSNKQKQDQKELEKRKYTSQ